jgi:hypothetical protein
MSDWTREKANQVLSSFSWSAKFDGNPLEVVVDALRDAEKRGLESAAQICERQYEVCRNHDDALGAYTCTTLGGYIRAAKRTEEDKQP